MEVGGEKSLGAGHSCISPVPPPPPRPQLQMSDERAGASACASQRQCLEPRGLGPP